MRSVGLKIRREPRGIGRPDFVREGKRTGENKQKKKQKSYTKQTPRKTKPYDKSTRHSQASKAKMGGTLRRARAALERVAGTHRRAKQNALRRKESK
jgi:hypothetical protein